MLVMVVFLFAGNWSHMVKLLFFFSIRRRHTILQGDWSSDVCSSDLGKQGREQPRAEEAGDEGECRDEGKSVSERASEKFSRHALKHPSCIYANCGANRTRLRVPR